MYNIATVNWLIGAVGANVPMKKFSTFQPNDMLCYTDEIAYEFRRKYDKYSDSFTKNVSTDQLRAILNAMDEKVLYNPTCFELLKKSLLDFIKGTGTSYSFGNLSNRNGACW